MGLLAQARSIGEYLPRGRLEEKRSVMTICQKSAFSLKANDTTLLTSVATRP